jgi:hypothetical protein
MTTLRPFLTIAVLAIAAPAMSMNLQAADTHHTVVSGDAWFGSLDLPDTRLWRD